MKIWCNSCGFSEETNLNFFVKLIGAAMPAGGLWAWVTFLFAGTGFALPICFAIVTGGAGILIYKDEIIKWVTNKGHTCPKCDGKSWEIIQDDV
tara:strand:- start:65 stop:346 length:282 start_codon:yes stop_codon:yes gene_type:complete